MDNNEIFGLLFLAIFACIGLAFAALAVWIWFRIISRTGHNGWLALLMLIPMANLVMLLILAFGDWPVLREVEALRRQVRETGSGQASF